MGWCEMAFDENIGGYIIEDGEEQMNSPVIEMSLHNGEVKKYALMGMFVADVFQYMALAPMDDEDMEVLIVPFEEGEDDTVEFRDFYNEEEYIKAEEAFHKMFDEDDEFVINMDEVIEECELTQEDYNIFD